MLVAVLNIGLTGLGFFYWFLRLLVWDAFASHKNEGNELKETKGTKVVLKELGIEAAYIPGGCTKLIQVG
uniref:Uncharacterized protein n=1 Tax=Ditylenchus dipsaci TaxID=166011 RepID=A0A915D063_9BILA